MELAAVNDDFGSSYAPLPAVPEAQVDRTFLLSDGNVEITSMDIAPHGAFVVVGSSSGMVLLFDISNPSSQKDGLLIGQIRARGMHTNLILTVKFSEDGRFVFAGVSKGSSEMLAIDLGKVLVDWSSAGQSESGSGANKEASETLQQLQLQSTVTFSFSDAKLRGFGAVVRMDHPRSSEGQPKPVAGSFSDSSALYRLACGRGIKNVHIWHFTVGYLTSAKASELSQDAAGVEGQQQQQQQRMMHGKWEYVCDVASNGNTITHIEFRQGGNELISKSAGMSIRVWDLRGNETLNSTNTGSTALLPADVAAASGLTVVEGTIAPSAAAAAAPAASSGSSWLTIKPTYADISNSQDVKCLLPVGTGAYGGTYQFAVLNTSAPREANRDVLELPERFSGDAAAAVAAASGGLTSNASSNNLLRGRRITREIEQVICTDEGSHALLLCADGGVVYYRAPTSDASCSVVGSESDEASEHTRSGASALLELPDLFRQKDLQQHTGSWALRRVGRQGLVVLLRAYPEAGSNAVVVEARPLSEHLPEDAGLRLADSEVTALPQQQQQQQLLYYKDSSTHAVQEAARRAWRMQPASAKRSASSGNPASALRVAKKAKVCSEGEVEAPPQAKKKTVSVVTGEKSPRPPVLSLASQEKKNNGAALVTPAAAPFSASKLNKVSPFDATERLISTSAGGGAEGSRLGGCAAVSPVTGPAPVPAFRSSRISSRQSSSSTSSFAKLRALRDDDSSAGEEEGAELELSIPHFGGAQKRSVPTIAVEFSYKEISVGPAPKVRRLSIPPIPAALSAAAANAATAPAAGITGFSTPTSDAAAFRTAAKVLESWWDGSFHRHCGSPSIGCMSLRGGEAVLGLGGGRSLGSTGLQRLGVILMEQDRLKAQFVREVAGAVTPFAVSEGAFRVGTGGCEEAVNTLIGRFRATADELVRRQQLELQGACAIDSICSSNNSNTAASTRGCWGDDLKVVFRHESILSQAATLHMTLCAQHTAN